MGRKGIHPATQGTLWTVEEHCAARGWGGRAPGAQWRETVVSRVLREGALDPQSDMEEGLSKEVPQ